MVNGRSEVPADQRATTQEATIAHFAFDTMVMIGTVLLLLAAWYGLAWLRRRDMPRSRWFYRCAAVAGIASVIAVESGLITAEVGRQPWIVWEQMKVAQAVTNISAGPIWASFAILVVLYALVAWAFVSLLLRLRLRWRREDAGLPPDADAPVAGPGRGSRLRGRAGSGRRAAAGRGHAVTSAEVVALVLVLAVAAYACGGGADYGAGFWDLTAGGDAVGARPRALVDYAMAPVWEANNVWLIFVFVVTWTGFPTSS